MNYELIAPIIVSNSFKFKLVHCGLKGYEMSKPKMSFQSIKLYNLYTKIGHFQQAPKKVLNVSH